MFSLCRRPIELRRGPPHCSGAIDRFRRRRAGTRTPAVVLARVDQLDRVVVAGLGPQRQVARQVIQDGDGAGGADHAARVAQVELARDPLAQRQRGGLGAAVGPLRLALERQFIEPEGALEAALVGPAAAAEQGERRLLQQGRLGAGAAGRAAQHQPGQFLAFGQVGIGVQAQPRRQRGAAELDADALVWQRSQRQQLERRVVIGPVEVEQSGFDLESLTPGAVLAALGPDLASELGHRLAVVQAQQQFALELAVQPLSAQLEVVAQSKLELQPDRLCRR